METTEARQLAEDHLREALPARWAHVQGVAATAHRIGVGITLDVDVLVCAAWLHDIGYAPSIASSGFHPLDGARFLRAHGWRADVCNLVAHHTCARVEASQRGVAGELCEEFADAPTPERDALWTADATTGPDGQPITLAERVHEIEQRYGSEDVVARCMRIIRPELQAAIQRTRSRAVVTTQPR